VEEQQLVDAGAPWPTELNGAVETCFLEFILENVVPVEAERMWIAKAIAG
jgi:hypothetical protein